MTIDRDEEVEKDEEGRASFLALMTSEALTTLRDDADDELSRR